MKKIYLIVISVLSLILTFATVIFSSGKIVNSKTELLNVDCGFPFPFLSGNLSKYDPPYPYRMYCTQGTWGEVSLQINFLHFILSYLFFLISVLAIFYAVRSIRIKFNSSN